MPLIPVLSGILIPLSFIASSIFFLVERVAQEPTKPNIGFTAVKPAITALAVWFCAYAFFKSAADKEL